MSVIGFIVGFVMFGAMTFLPLYQQTVQGASATNSGLLLMPMLLGMMVVSVIAGRATSATGRYKIFPIIGSALMVVGLYLLSTLTISTSRVTSGLYMAVLGAGMGFLMQITMLVAQNSVDMKDMGVASSSTTLFRTIGGSFGVSLFGALFTHQVTHTMVGRLGAHGAALASGTAQQSPKAAQHMPAAVRDAYFQAVTDGTNLVFFWGAVFAVICFVAAWLVKEIPLRGAQPAAPAESGVEAPEPLAPVEI